MLTRTRGTSGTSFVTGGGIGISSSKSDAGRRTGGSEVGVGLGEEFGVGLRPGNHGLHSQTAMAMPPKAKTQKPQRPPPPEPRREVRLARELELVERRRLAIRMQGDQVKAFKYR